MSVRDHLQAIYDKHGSLTPDILLEEARDPKHPLHKSIFKLELKEAAWAWYREQAHELIRSVKITYRKTEGTALDVRAFHAIRRENGYTYEPTEKVAQDPFLKKLLMADMEREWKQLRQRYDSTREFWELIAKDLEAIAA